MQIKDSGEKREFQTGAHRDMAEGKGRCDLLPCMQVKAAFELAKKEVDVNERWTNEDVNNKILELLMCALENLMSAVNDLKEKNDNDATTENILRTIYLSTAAEGLRENMKTGDCNNLSLRSMFCYGMMQVSKHYEEGANKYGPDNWKNGMPLHVYIDSGLRHLLKANSEMYDEPHIRATVWNLMGYLYTKENKPEMNDFL